MATITCQTKGCNNQAHHYWFVSRGGDEGFYAYLCSECKLKVQSPYLETPDIEVLQAKPDISGYNKKPTIMGADNGADNGSDLPVKKEA